MTLLLFWFVWTNIVDGTSKNKQNEIRLDRMERKVYLCFCQQIFIDHVASIQYSPYGKVNLIKDVIFVIG